MVFSTYVKSCLTDGEDPNGGPPHGGDSLTLRIVFRDEDNTDPQLLNLRQFFGNKNGRFELGSTNFDKDVTRSGVVNAILLADLPYGKNANGDNLPVPTQINLNQCFHYVAPKYGEKAKVEFRLPSKKVLESCDTAELDGTILNAVCLGYDGDLHPSAIDLSRYISVDYVSGTLKSDPERGGLDSRTANLKLSGWKLSGTLAHDKSITIAEFDLSTYLENDHGQLIWHTTTWTSRDGPIANFMNRVPVLGYIAGLFHDKFDNSDEVNKTLAEVTNCTIIFAGGLLAGLLSATLGLALTAGAVTAAVTAAVLTPLAIEVENLIKDGTINEAKKTTIEEKLQLYVKSAVINAFVAGTAPYLRSLVVASKSVAGQAALRTKAKDWIKESATEYWISLPTTEGATATWNLMEETSLKIVQDGVSDASNELSK